jgi:DNA-binding NtrC family response regulator
MGRFQNPEGVWKQPAGGPFVAAGPGIPLPAAAEAGKVADTPADAAAEPPQTLEDIEKNAILSAIERCGGNRSKAAEELGITRKTILNKLKGR